MYCVVQNCKSVWKPNSNINFHSFPKDIKRRNIWLAKVQIKGKLYTSAKICSLHFKAADYYTDRPGHLLNSAVPFNATSTLCECVSTSVEDCSLESSTGTAEPAVTAVNIDSKDNLLLSLLKCPRNMLPDEISQPGSSEFDFIVDDDAAQEPQEKRPCLKDVSAQVKMKSPRVIALEKNNKILQQTVLRQQKKIRRMQSLISMVRNYTSQPEIENILQGNFANICKAFNHNTTSKGIQYSDEVKAFAFTVHFYSPKAYKFLRTILSLPPSAALERLSVHDR